MTEQSTSKSEQLPFVPVIIIGAGRSGTNAMRDALTSLPGFATWPCDEINPIWRHGNTTVPHDEFDASMARPGVTAFIRRAFFKIWRQTGQPKFVVEKTCANSLRVDFINAVFPEARFIYIVRNGIDVVASARKRWRSELEVPALAYFYAKAVYVPLSDIPYYGFRFVKARLGKLLGRSDKLDQWGPRPKLFAALNTRDLEEICALQWNSCVTSSDAAFATIPRERYLYVTYEQFATNPAGVLGEINDFLGAGAAQGDIGKSAQSIHRSSVGKGKRNTSRLAPGVLDCMRESLVRHGYGDSQ